MREIKARNSPGRYSRCHLIFLGNKVGFRGEFSEKELAQLTLSIIAINGWNRLNVAFRTPAGNYKSEIKQSVA